MSTKLFDYFCEDCGRSWETWVEDATCSSVCPYCGKTVNHAAYLKVSFKLDGTDTSFPSASDKWATYHEKKARAESWETND